jgi:soluble lytic murein transglycosylase-like protein
MTLHRFSRSILLLFALVVAVAAQSRHEPSLSERARQLEPFIIASARTYGIDAGILRALCFIESRYRTEAVSPRGARGPMQFMPETAARYGLHDPRDPQSAIDAAARYLRVLLQRFDGRVDLALAAYNAGEGAVTSFMTGKPLLLRSGKLVNARGLVTGGIPPYLETQQYVRSAIALLHYGNAASAKHIVKANSEGARLRLNSLKDFTLDSLSNLDTPPAKTTSRNPSSFIEIQ